MLKAKVPTLGLFSPGIGCPEVEDWEATSGMVGVERLTTNAVLSLAIASAFVREGQRAAISVYKNSACLARAAMRQCA
eukprot:2047666-Lingulodinium_polyedra.AAC.1